MSIKDKVVVIWVIFWSLVFMYFGIGIIKIATTWQEVLDYTAITILSMAALMVLSAFDLEPKK